MFTVTYNSIPVAKFIDEFQAVSFALSLHKTSNIEHTITVLSETKVSICNLVSSAE